MISEEGLKITRRKTLSNELKTYVVKTQRKFLVGTRWSCVECLHIKTLEKKRKFFEQRSRLNTIFPSIWN